MLDEIPPKPIRLNPAGSKLLIDFFTNITSRPSRQQLEELAVQVAVRPSIHHVSTSIDIYKTLDNSHYSKQKIGLWFTARRYTQKCKIQRGTIQDLSNVADASTSDIPAAPTPTPPPIPATKTKRPRKKRVPKSIDISHHATLAVLCAEVPLQSAKNLASTWASILKCDEKLINLWIDDYYGASIDLPMPETVSVPVLQDPEPMQDGQPLHIDEPISPDNEPIQIVDEPLLARVLLPPLNIYPYKGISHFPSPTAPYMTFAYGYSYRNKPAPKPPHEDLLCVIAKRMDAADLDMDCQPTSMSLGEFNARLEPVLERVKDLLGRLGRGEPTCLN